MNLTNMVYNFKDQLIEKNIAFDSTHALQSIDYQYNTRGWLTAINNVNIYGGNGDDKKSIFTSGSTGKGTLKYFFKQ